MITHLVLERDLAQQIADLAQTALPGECCGLIAGVLDGETARAIILYPAHNLSTDPTRFQIAPEDHIAAQKAARGDGHVLIGCYHSHPGGMPRPSSRDAAEASERDFIWLIAAQGQGGWDLAAFAYRGDGLFADLVTSSG
jgi:proteasome lid subunit RPN8/RPN11